MGRKFASMHIYDPQLSIDQDSFKMDYLGTLHDVEQEWRRRVRLYCGNPSVFGINSEGDIPEDIQKSVKQMLLEEREAVRLSRQGRFLSVYDDSFTFETIEEAALTVSARTAFPILYASEYDGDIFTAGLCSYGTVLTRHVSGDTRALEEYGLNRCFADADVLCDALGVQNVASAKKLCKQSGVGRSEALLEKALGIRLSEYATFWTL